MIIQKRTQWIQTCEASERTASFPVFSETAGQLYLIFCSHICTVCILCTVNIIIGGFNMSDLSTANCGCGCDDSCTGNSGCGLGRCFGDCNSIIWILLILCCCGNGNNGCGCGQHNGYGNDCNCIIILLLLLCGCGGNNFC